MCVYVCMYIYNHIYIIIYIFIVFYSYLQISYSCTFHPEPVGFPDQHLYAQKTNDWCVSLCMGKHALTPANPEKNSQNFFEHITTQAGACQLQIWTLRHGLGRSVAPSATGWLRVMDEFLPYPENGKVCQSAHIFGPGMWSTKISIEVT